jgi:hypothetical protein
MSHVDDGTIQAYLDHQLEFTEPEARRAFEQHLADHPDDAARVEVARAIHERATGLLGHRDLRLEDIPPFEAVQERARAMSSRKAQITKLRTVRTLALAASVAAVFAVGWWVRPNVMADRTAPASAVNEAEPRANEPNAEASAQAPQLADQDRQDVAPPADDRAVGFAEAERPERDVAAEAAANRVVAPVTSDARKAAEEAQGLRQQQSQVAGAASAAGRGVAAPPPAPQRARRAAGDAVALDEVTAERRERQADADSVSVVAAQVSRDLLREAEPTPAENFRQVSPTTDFAAWNDATISEAEQLLGVPVLAIEGLTIERVGTAAPSGYVEVFVLQRLESGAAVGLLQTAAPIPGARREGVSWEDLLERLEDYPNVVTGGLLVIGVADLPRDSLETLLGNLREAPRTN